MRIRVHGPLLGFFVNLQATRQAHQTRTLWTPPRPTIELGEKCRTRFAPSPTGALHLGSLRTALFNYLLAKKTGGEFLVRIEDTDRARTIPLAEEGLLKDLRWAGLQYDEGPDINGPHGPYKQSERLSIYETHVEKLLKTGKAYRCFCSSKDRKSIQASNQKHETYGYDRTCAHIPVEESNKRAENERFVVRLLLNETHNVSDLVYGRIKHDTRAFGPKKGRYQDPVLIKRDRWPTYHFANVVDDHLMKITHVIRGSEWIPSTHQHIALYKAFGWKPPKFAHVPLLTEPSGQKLSKRLSAQSVAKFREDGIFPEALVNFAALLGWSARQKSDILSLKDLEQMFDLKITKGNTKVNMDKLTYLQKAHTKLNVDRKGQSFDTIVDLAVKLVEEKYHPSYEPLLGNRTIHEYVEQILLVDRKNLGLISQFIEESSHLFFSVKALRTRAPPALVEPAPVDENASDIGKSDHELIKSPGRVTDMVRKLRIDVGALAGDPYFLRLISGTESNWSAWEKEEIAILTGLLKAIPVEEWTAPNLKTVIGSAGARTREQREKTVNRRLTQPTIDAHLDASLKAVWKYARYGVAFGKSGMAVVDMMVILGREESLKRMDFLYDSATLK